MVHSDEYTKKLNFLNTHETFAEDGRVCDYLVNYSSSHPRFLFLHISEDVTIEAPVLRYDKVTLLPSYTFLEEVTSINDPIINTIVNANVFKIALVSQRHPKNKISEQEIQNVIKLQLLPKSLGIELLDFITMDNIRGLVSYQGKIR